MKYILRISAFFLLFIMAACGKKGPIELPTSESYVNPGLQSPEAMTLAITDLYTYFYEFDLFSSEESWLGFSKDREIRTLLYTPVEEDLDTDSTVYTLKLKIKRAVDSASAGFTLYPVTKDWSSTYINWDEYDDGESWDSAGGDYDPALSVHGTVDAAEDEFIEVDITGFIEYWKTHDNDGIIIVPDIPASTDMSIVSFYTQNADSEDDQPLIEYFDGTETQTISVNSLLHIADLSGSQDTRIEQGTLALGDSFAPGMTIDFSAVDFKWEILEAVLSFEADESLLKALFDVDTADIENTETLIYAYSVADNSADNFDFDDYSTATPGYDSESGRITLEITGVLRHARENGYDIALIPKSNKYMLRYIDLSNPSIDIVYRKNITDYEEEL